MIDVEEVIPLSHHFDTPTAREDPRLNLCDFYLFDGAPDTTVMAMTVNPTAAIDTPAPFRDEALYVFRLDTDGDRREDVSFKVRFGEQVGAAQTCEVRRAFGEDAASSDGGRVIASGTTGVITGGDSGVRAYAGSSTMLSVVTRRRSTHSRMPSSLVSTSQRPSTTALFGTMTLPCRLGTVASFDYTGFNGRALPDNVMDNTLSLLTNPRWARASRPTPDASRTTFPTSCPAGRHRRPRRKSTIGGVPRDEDRY